MSRSPELTRRILNEAQWRTLDYLYKRWAIERRPRDGTHVQPHTYWAQLKTLRVLAREGCARRRRDYTWTITPHGRRTALVGPPDGFKITPGRYVWEAPDLWREWL